MILQDIEESKISIDKISQFSIRPTEFCYVFDKVEIYYRWFETVENTVLSCNEMLVKLSINMECSMWIDGLQRIVKFREAALPEIYKWLEDLQHSLPGHQDEVVAISEMGSLFDRIKEVFDMVESECELDEEDNIFLCS